jgi:acetaldehyde dehydrogenase/alcohol dehydrogenase
MNQFKPDVIIAVGGGSPIDAAKAMWMMYEHPDMNLDFESGTFAEHRTHAYDLPNMGTLAELVCVPTTSGTGSEVTPFSVISDPASGKKFPLADYGLTPSMSIIDPQLVMSMPKKITSTSGFDALSHALESLVSAYATDFSKPFSKEAACLLLKYLPRAYKQGEVDVEAREKVHYAASIAGLAFANAFLGVGNAVAHKLCFTLRIPQGMADAAIISHVVAYNSKDPVACHEYAEVAHHLGLPGRTDQEKVTELIKLIEQIKTDCGIPNTIEQILGASRESDFMGHVDVMASEAMADPSTDANPRPVDVEDVKRMLRDAWKNPVKV